MLPNLPSCVSLTIATAHNPSPPLPQPQHNVYNSISVMMGIFCPPCPLRSPNAMLRQSGKPARRLCNTPSSSNRRELRHCRWLGWPEVGGWAQGGYGIDSGPWAPPPRSGVSASSLHSSRRDFSQSHREVTLILEETMVKQPRTTHPCCYH